MSTNITDKQDVFRLGLTAVENIWMFLVANGVYASRKIINFYVTLITHNNENRVNQCLA